ncbi:MAG: TatD family hydrolase [Acidobacteria bacterium]|nr:TatD family hydrolase [Acidobacteriota bacterium]
MIDSHCHLADAAYVSDVDAVITRAIAAGLTGALCVIDASDGGETQRVGAIAARWPSVRTTAGVHPHRAGAYSGAPREAVELVRRRLMADSLARAVGEVGLDYHYDLAPRDTQRAVFGAQVALAREVGLPLVIHTREADDDTVAILEEAGQGQVRGVFHCFSGGVPLARRALDLGFHVSFSGIVTFPKGEDVRAAAATIPLDRLLVETDCPYLAPVPHRGKRNEPAWVVRVIERLAAVHGVSTAVMAAATAENYHNLFMP